MENFTWIPSFKALSDWLLGQQNNQSELVNLLKSVGVTKGLTDKDKTGNTVLTEIDPFTFFSLLMKYGEKVRLGLFEKLHQELKLSVEPPKDFDGVPNANAQKSWMFPYASKRETHMVPALWDIFKAAKANKINNELFENALQVPNTGFVKLTECLFYVCPDVYFPIDSQTKPWLERQGIKPPKANWYEYQRCMQDVSEKSDLSFPEISFIAYTENKKNNDEEVLRILEAAFPSDIETVTTKKKIAFPLNQILYGPPGTGKTFNTTRLAVQIAEPQWYSELLENKTTDEDERERLKSRYQSLVKEGRIAFSTFHQSMAYEDFIEGIRAFTDEEQQSIGYRTESGIFKELAEKAERATKTLTTLGVSNNPKIWKISIGPVSATEKRRNIIEAAEARIGWNKTGDLNLPYEDRDRSAQEYWDHLKGTNRNSIENFAFKIEPGDVLLCLKDTQTIQAVGIVTSDYRYDSEAAADDGDDYAHFLHVNWVLKDVDFNIIELNDGKKLTPKTIYQLDRFNWDELVVALNKQGYKLPYQPDDNTAEKPNYVLIIDEINRGNVSRIFGELITLLEPDKRKGGSDERSVILPYSKKSFSVPSNLHVIGTMNTADRSLTQIDVALRRRFEFVEMLPNPDLLEGTEVYKIDLSQLLTNINQRIEILLDRDHLIGHAYFIPLLKLDTDDEMELMLANIFRLKVLPLLQEYFFADWERIAWVLNDTNKPKDARFIHMRGDDHALERLFNQEIAKSLTDRRYEINAKAFHNPLAYQGILGE